MINQNKIKIQRTTLSLSLSLSPLFSASQLNTVLLWGMHQFDFILLNEPQKNYRLNVMTYEGKINMQKIADASALTIISLRLILENLSFFVSCFLYHC